MTDISHYGVLGMKWGVRRSDAELAKEQKRKNSYTKGQRAVDKRLHGTRGVKRIEKRIIKGKTRSEAVKAERGRAVVNSLLIGAAALAVVSPYRTTQLARAGVRAADDVVVNRMIKNSDRVVAEGARRAAAMVSDKRGLTSLNTITLSPSQYTSKIL